jgi:arylsulfatase
VNRVRACFAPWLGALALACAVEAPPSLVIVTLDTTRVDHLSCYGYERETSPNLDRLAARSVRYTRAWSTSSWTLPAHASLFTGLFPSAHGAQFDSEGAELTVGFRARVLADRHTTLAELLAERGYRTGAFVGGPWMKRDFGVLQGFEHVDDSLPSGVNGPRASELTDRAIAWLGDTPGDRPFFLFVNYFDPHSPYEPPPGFDTYPHARRPVPDGWWREALERRQVPPQLRATLIDRYDGEIRSMDAALGRLIEAVDAGPGGDRVLWVVTADHGESFGERGWFLHNGSLTEETVRIPLIIRHPGGDGAGTTSNRTVQLVDVLPIVATELGVPVPAASQGVLPGERKRAYLELLRNPFRVALFGERFDRDLEAVIEWPHKLVVADGARATLFELDGITETVAPVNAQARTSRLAEDLDLRRQATAPPPDETTVVDPESVEALRALGYLN